MPPISKGSIRDDIWNLLEQKDIADFPRPCFGRIPNFVGSRAAAERIMYLTEFKQAGCIFCAPDLVLKRVREIVLETGKVLAVALPHMKDFVEIRERKKISTATNIKGFRRFGTPLKTKIGLFVQGSVAVDRKGNRLGKGKGYGDREWEYLLRKGLIHDKVKVVALVHDEQMLDDFSQVMETNDKKVDYVLTPSQVTCF